MNRDLKLITLLSCLSLLILSCNLSGFSRFFGEYPTNPGDLLFQDGFADTSSGWDRVRTTEGMTDYQDGRYRIVVNSANADFWTNPGLTFDDVLIDVDAGKSGGPDDNDFGVLCRYQDTKNFYFLIISSDGYYGIGKVEDGAQSLLEPPHMYHSDVILTGEATNHIQAECNGSRIALAVNGVLIAEATDTTFSNGDIGLIVGSFGIPGVDIWFDNLMVRVP